MQRAFDVLIASVALLVLSPLLIPLTLLLRLTGEGEIFYCQIRVGQGGKPFRVWKFATMIKDSPAIGTGTITIKNDPRVLPLGKFLRKSKINELPQLFNVLTGTMSIIGPRPQTLECFNAFPANVQESIKTMRPGLSGIGSIVFRNEESLMHFGNCPVDVYSNLIMPFKGQLEEWYLNNQSIFTYFKLIFLTIAAIFHLPHKIIWSVLPSLPHPNAEIAEMLEVEL